MNDLEHLCKAYLHQSWTSEYSSWESALDDFLVRSPGRAAGALAEIDSLLSRTKDDDALAHALDELGCEYTSDDSDRTWLRAVRSYLVLRLTPGNATGPESATT